MTLLQHYQLGFLSIGVVAVGIGLFVLAWKRQEKVAQWLCLYLLLVGWWCWCQMQAGVSGQPEISLIWGRAMFVVVAAFPVLLTHFFSVLLGVDQKYACRVGWLMYGAFLPFIFTDYFLKAGGTLDFLPAFPRAGALFLPFNLVWLGWICYDFFWLLARGPRQGSYPTRPQIIVLLAAFLSGYLSGCTNYFYFYGICLTPLQPLVNYWTAVAISLIVYGIFAYHLFDIQVVIRRGILGSLVLGSVIAAYFGSIYAAERLFKMTLLNHHVLALSLSAITVFILGLIVFLAEPKKRLNQIFGLYSLAIAWWSFNESFAIGAPNYATASFWAYLEWPAVIFIAPTFLHTILLSTEEKRTTTKAILASAYLLSFVLAVLHVPFGMIMGSLRSVSYLPFFTRLTRVGLFIPLLFLILVNIGLWKLGRAYWQATGQRRTQLKYLFWASVIGYVGGSPDWFLVFGFHLPVVSPFGIYCVPLYSIAVTYAVLHHKLFHVNLVIRKSLVYSLLVTALTVGYFGLLFLIERFFQVTFGYHSAWVSLSAFAVMALVFQPLKIGVQRIVDWLFFRAPHEEMVRRMERLEQEVRQSEKLKAISTLAAGMAHEIKNPLCAIKTFAEFLPEKGTDPEFQRKFQRIVTKEVDKIDRIVRQLLEFSRPTPPQLQPTAVSHLLDETLDFLSNDCLTRRIAVERSYATEDTIQADPQQLRQVFLNLLLNSLDAMNGHGGQLSVVTTQENGHLNISIRDTGCGIPKEQLSHIFDPFFTTKQGGTGLGLSIVQGIIKEHRGSISFDSQPNRGTTCTIIFSCE